MAKSSGGVRGGGSGGRNQDAIDKARSIMDNFDFHWQMVDFGFDQARRRAQSQMREFARYAKMAGTKRLTKELRDEWTRRYEDAKAMRNRRF